MTALADPIYLPVLSPTRMGTGIRTLLEQRLAESARGEVSTRSITEIADEAIKAGSRT